MPIHFGTDGWRAVISDSFTFGNLRMVAQAIADAVASDHWDKAGNGAGALDPRKIVVGFDTRFLSDRYAGEVARVLAANGYTVLLTQADAPTPAISFAVKNQGAIAGIMITASHNAPRYNGVKLKAAFGGSALPEQCRRVEIYINDNEEQARGPNLMDFKKARDEGLIQKFNPLPAYFDHLRTLIDTDTIAENPQRFVTDAMYGSGRGVIKSFLQGTGCEVAEIRGEMNPGFGSVHPEPIAKYLGPLASAVSSGIGNFGVVTDGDADRIGAMDERGAFVDPHKIMALSLKYLVEKRGMSGAVVRTVSTTRMIDRLAKRYGLTLHETPVGFNHIADYMMSEDVLIGGEESGGISFKGHIGLDFVALGKLFEDLGHWEEAARLFEHGLEFELIESDFGEAVKRLSILQKRRGDLGQAVRLWEDAAQRGHLYAFIELAKYYEHKQRNIRSAMKWAKSALKSVDKIDMPAYMRKYWTDELEHRMERLNRKAGI